MDQVSVSGTTLRVVQGDITEQAVDAIVNAANSTLLGGGGVDGAIHRRGGPAILEECRALRRGRFADGLPTGEAVATAAGDLPARWVIHAVGPVWRGGASGEPERLRSAYRRSLEEAHRVGARSLAFPSISTGAYGYPVEEAALQAVSAIGGYLEEHPGSLREVRMVAFSAADAAAYRNVLANVER
jgi:O-acetyl-ADP-ribose deacetylase